MRATHLVAAVHFTHKSPGEEAPVECRCGWTGIVKDFQPHRREQGETLRSVANGINLGHPSGWKTRSIR